MPRVSRREFIAGSSVALTTAATAGLATGCSRAETGPTNDLSPGTGASATANANAAANATAGSDTGTASGDTVLAQSLVAFDGRHQAGIGTQKQAWLNLLGFDLNDGAGKDEVENLLRLWTTDARALCTGEAPLGSLEPEMVAWPANLTITCGVGPGVFSAIGAPELKPEWLRDIRPFDRDKLEDIWGQTDIAIQICCDDQLMASHAMRHMIRAGQDYATVRWVQQGFANAHGSVKPGTSERNLFGQVDGTQNPRTDEEFAQFVWIDKGAPFTHGGTAMVARRIRMNIDTWEMLDRASRENAIGRDLPAGAPLSGGGEFDALDFAATDKYGLPVIDPNSHVARAQPADGHPEQRILRRAYNYDLAPDFAPNRATGDGETEPDSPQLSNSGLIFLCYQKDPTTQFEPIQARLDESDILNTWITHIGSAVYFLPPGTTASTAAAGPSDSVGAGVGAGVGSGEGSDTFWAESLIKAAAKTVG